LVPFRVFELKKYDRRNCFVLELVPLRGEKDFKPRPQNRTLVPLRGSFKNFRRAPPPLLYESLPLGVKV